MILLTDYHDELKTMNQSIIRLMDKSGYLEDDELPNIQCDTKDPNDNFLYTEIRNIMNMLDNVSTRLQYLDKPIKQRGVLKINSHGRYELNDIELTCGAQIEIYDPDYNEWSLTRIEHRDNRYIAIGYRGVLEGIKARLR